MWTFPKKALTVLLLIFLLSGSLWAQEEVAEPVEALPPARPPAMKSIFWNTVMGSAWGAVMGGTAALSSDDVPFRDSMIFGTTIGGLMGYGFGVYLVIRGITFDPRLIPTPPTTPLGQAHYSPTPMLDGPVLLSTESQMLTKKKENGWNATIFDWSF